MKKTLLFIVALCLPLFGKLVEDMTPATLNPIQLKFFNQHSTTTLVSKGKLNFAIAADTSVEKNIIPERRSVTKAVEVITDAFFRCTGQHVHTFHPDDPQLQNYPVILSLGDTKYARSLNIDTAELGKHEFIVRAITKVVAIAGYDGSFIPGSYTNYDWPRIRYNGTLNGAYDFVERILGVRYYYPGNGTIYPPCDDLSIYQCAYTDKPYFLNRFSYTIARAQKQNSFYPEMNATSDEDWEGRYRIARQNGFWADNSPAIELLNLKHPDKIKVTNYTDEKGHLYYDKQHHLGNFLDITNLDVVDILMQEIHEHYSSNGENQSVWLNYQANLDCVTFGQYNVTMPPLNNEIIQKLNLIPPELRNNKQQELSNVYARFIQHLARKLNEGYPGRRLVITPEYKFTLPPTMSEYSHLPDNVEICMKNDDILNMAPNTQYLQQCKKLLKLYYDALEERPAAALWITDQNSNQWARAINGRYITTIVNELKPMLGNEEIKYDINTRHKWELFYNHYITWRLLWNPQFNVDAALDEMWNLLYGKAAPHIKSFYVLLRTTYEQSVQPNNSTEQSFTPDVINKMKSLLETAEDSIPPNSIEAKRLALFTKYWKPILK